MKNTDQTMQREAGRTFAQEMQKAYADWVEELPLIRDVSKSPMKGVAGEMDQLIGHTFRGDRSCQKTGDLPS
jgi:hypothetical protein